MKKLVVSMLIGAMVLGTAACGGKDNADASTESSVAESSVVQESEPVVESTEEASSEAESMPEEASGWSEEMTGLRTAVVEALGDNYWPAMAIPAEFLEGSYGLTSDMYVDYMGEMPMMSAHVDTLLIVKAAEGKEEAVEQALQNYRDIQVENSMQYPMNLGKVQAAQVERMGSYVCFVLLGGDTMAAAEQGDEAVIAHCQEQNQMALDAISGKLAAAE